MAAALQVWSATFARSFDALPAEIRASVERRIDEMGRRLERFPHQRLAGRPEFKLRIGDYRVLYEFDAAWGRIFLHRKAFAAATITRELVTFARTS